MKTKQSVGQSSDGLFTINKVLSCLKVLIYLLVYVIVVADSAIATCEIHEVKHSKEQTKEQYRHLIDEEKLKSTEFRYGKITKKVVIYCGENATLENGIEYRNVEEYLKSLV